jgi:hypothetical protein
MAVPWRPVRLNTPFEKADKEYNERLAEELLSSPQADDFCVAIDQVDWCLRPKSPTLAGERWPMNGDPKLCRRPAAQRRALE